MASSTDGAPSRAEQLTFELSPAPEPGFANFIVADNGEAVAALQAMASRDLRETGVVLWGAPGAGRTHLLKAVVAAALAAGRPARYLGADRVEVIVDDLPPGLLVAVDDIDGADALAQGRLFTLYNVLAACGGQLVAAMGQPPAASSLRPDLRTRLGYGLVLEIKPLSDADKAAAMTHYARSRGFELPPEVARYLLARERRDLGRLLGAVAEIDRFSLAVRRPVTVPLVREWMQSLLNF